jgi:CBS domain containing-hemolysin-like protein
MVGETDQQQKNESRKIALALVGVVSLVVIAGLLMLPSLAEAMAPGLGLKDAAIIAFFVTAILLIIFAVAAGDGLLGELQYMLAGFFLFYLIFWLMIAWVF